jgi:shikimate kinase
MKKDKYRNIILTGIKHSGKSTLGKAISDKIGFKFYDLDNIIEKKSSSRKIRDIFRDSEENFRRLEAEAAEYLSLKMEKERICAALGGSTAVNQKAIECLKNSGVIVYLYVKHDILFKRVMSSGVPPFLSMENAYDDFKTLYMQRDIIHKKTADIIIKLNGLDIKQGTEHILNKVKNII